MPRTGRAPLGALALSTAHSQVTASLLLLLLFILHLLLLILFERGEDACAFPLVPPRRQPALPAWWAGQHSTEHRRFSALYGNAHFVLPAATEVSRRFGSLATPYLPCHTIHDSRCCWMWSAFC